MSNLKNSLPRLMVRNLLLVFSSRHFQSFKSTLQKEKCKPIFSKLLITNFSLPYLGYKKRSFSVVYLWWFGGLVAKSCPTLATPWTVTCQPPLPMGFSRQEYCSGLPFPSSGDLPNSGIEPGSPICRRILYHLSHEESIHIKGLFFLSSSLRPHSSLDL